MDKVDCLAKRRREFTANAVTANAVTEKHIMQQRAELDEKESADPGPDALNSDVSLNLDVDDCESLEIKRHS